MNTPETQSGGSLKPVGSASQHFREECFAHRGYKLDITMANETLNMNKKKNLLQIEDEGRLLYYRPLTETRPDGVCATLVGYSKNGRDYWY